MMEQMMQEAAGKVIPAGYKQTEVGVIPEDWDVLPLNKVANFKNGIAHEDCVCESGEYVLVNSKFISSEGLSEKMSRDCRQPAVENDILMVMSDVPNGKAIAKCYLVNASGRYTVNQRICILSSQLVNSKYLFYKLNRNPFYLSFDDGAKQTNLRRQDVLDCLLAIPAEAEQTAIANVLSDSDALIGALEQLIAKKQAIKTATMQQLLTGRTRLPQFAQRPDGTSKGYKASELGQIPEDWEVLAIDDCATKVGSGKTPNGGASVYIDAGRPFVRSQNIGWGRLILDDVAYISDDIHNTFSGSEIKEGDVLLNITGASIGRCAITEGDIVGGNVNQHVCIIRLSSVLLNARLLVELINSRNGQKQIDSYQAGGNREGLNFQQVRQLKFAVSNSSVEQTAIATILSDLDSELNALEQKLAKARDVKQGMMQQLLTGRIRLPLPKEA
ncbi:restriction endonuclease subunit S [Aeromonas rivipollensis]